MQMQSCEKTGIRQWHKGAWIAMQDTVAQEIRLFVEYEGDRRALWSRPQELGALALGHVLLDWGLDRVQKASDCLPESDSIPEPAAFPAPEDIQLEEGWADGKPLVRVHFTRPCAELRAGIHADPDADLHKRHAGQVSLPEPGSLCASALLEHMGAFLDGSGLWAGTGCSHRAALLRPGARSASDVLATASATSTLGADQASDSPCQDDSRISLVVEDIGRHNCLDRLAGHAALTGLVPGEHVLLTTARLTASLYAKALRLGIRFMVSRAAVTQASLRHARGAGVTLVGFCRPSERRLTVFADPLGRIAK